MPPSILRHAWQLIAADLGKTWRIVVVPWCLGVTLIVLIAAGAWATLSHDTPPNGAFVLTGLILVLIGGFVTFWVIVAWHRYALTGEVPDGVLPRLYPRRMLGYFGHFLLLGIIIAIPTAIIMSFMMPVLVKSFGLGHIGFGIPFVMFVINLIISYAFFRMCLVLPASALGERMTLFDSIGFTAGHSKTLWGVVIALSLLSLLVSGVSALIPDPTARGLVEFLLGTLVGFYVISVMSSLYARLVTDRG